MYSYFISSKILVYSYVIISYCILCISSFVIPPVKFEVFTPKGFRASIPVLQGIQLFAFHANINSPIDLEEGDINGDTRFAENGRFSVYDSDLILRPGDDLYYKVFILHNNVGYKENGKQFRVLERKPFKNITDCSPSVTKVYYSSDEFSSPCKEELIFEDDFNTSISTDNWQIEHRIPTYLGPDFEFNSYLNSNDTIYVKDSKLFLKPIPFQKNEEVRGELDLRKGCTNEKTSATGCFYQQKSVFLLPPVKSARISSKFNFKFGKIHTKCKLPEGDWIYPIIQIEAINRSDNNLPIIWITFSRGNDRLYGNDNTDLGSRLLFGGPIFDFYEPERSKFLRTFKADIPFNKGFHLYSVDWNLDSINFGIDNQIYGTIRSSELSSYLNISTESYKFRLSFGVGVGGITNFPDGFKSGSQEKPWNNADRDMLVAFFDSRNVWSSTWNDENSALQIDYVRIWAL